ncbi:unnamed protein product [Closterium sp. NIES-53]
MFVPYLFSHNIPPLPIYNKLWCAQGVVEDSGNILTYDTDVAEMNFRVPPDLAEHVVAHALKINDPD